MKVKSLIAAAALSVLSIGATAQTYAEIGITSVSYEESLFDVIVKSSPQSFRGVVGYELNETFAVEGHVGFGMSGDGIKVGGTSVPDATFDVDNVIGIYVKGKTKLTDNLEAFARAGLARAKGTASLDGVSASASESGFSYGVGLSYVFDKTTSLNIDYMSYLDRSSSKATGITVGLGFKF